MKIGFKIVVKILAVVLFAVFIAFFAYLLIGKTDQAVSIEWGANFSQKHATQLELDWKQTYTAILDDLHVKKLKVAAYWDLIESQEGTYNFDDLDWQVSEANKRGAQIILAAGMKVPRWPECHIPGWAKDIGKEKQQEKILKYLEQVVSRYKDKYNIWAWQVENEPYLAFGICPWQDENFLKKEIALVRGLDNSLRPIIISESGEWSLWTRAASNSDIVATTLYRRLWSSDFNFYVTVPLPPVYYWRKSMIIKNIYDKKVICGELQAEPWGKDLIYNLPLDEQLKTMDIDKFKETITYAKDTGLDTFYLWGTEWWYWMKEKQSQSEIWNEAKKLF